MKKLSHSDRLRGICKVTAGHKAVHLIDHDPDIRFQVHGFYTKFWVGCNIDIHDDISLRAVRDVNRCGVANRQFI